MTCCTQNSRNDKKNSKSKLLCQQQRKLTFNPNPSVCSLNLKTLLRISYDLAQATWLLVTEFQTVPLVAAKKGDSSLYHCNVVPTVSDGSCSFPCMLFDKTHNLSLLCWRAPTNNNRRSLTSEFHEFLFIWFETDLMEINFKLRVSRCRGA
jgi:hypothetical protein